MATPFVQGQLRDETLTIDIETSCGHCDRKINIRLDSDGKWDLQQTDAAPLVFEPSIDWKTFTKPNIIDDY